MDVGTLSSLDSFNSYIFSTDTSIGPIPVDIISIFIELIQTLQCIVLLIFRQMNFSLLLQGYFCLL